MKPWCALSFHVIYHLSLDICCSPHIAGASLHTSHSILATRTSLSLLTAEERKAGSWHHRGHWADPLGTEPGLQHGGSYCKSKTGGFCLNVSWMRRNGAPLTRTLSSEIKRSSSDWICDLNFCHEHPVNRIQPTYSLLHNRPDGGTEPGTHMSSQGSVCHL